jgi:tetratricopeptide (TPR) repeat protein
LFACLALITITWLVFGQTLGYDFVNFDDHVYVYDNPRITGGLTLGSISYAFTHTHARNWHPLTTISHMLDCQFYGLKAGGHHLTNVLLHSIAVVLLFLVLQQMTGSPSSPREESASPWRPDQTGSIWRSAFVAAVFAVHPLHVESVAWISERKDVLSAVFFMLTLGAYARHVRKPSVGRYLMVALFLALGLMSKPMLVTVPFVLLLLDYWPLNRVRGQTSEVRDQRSEIRSQWSVVSGLVTEKIPLFALSAFSCLATLLAQSHGPAAIDQLPLGWRLNNAVISYVIYVWQMFWSARLAVFYPHPNNQLPAWEIILATLFLLGVSLWAILLRKKRPYILTGWLWYVGMLVPVIGFVQVGEQARADRYTYLPQIGLYILITWAVADVIEQARECTRRAVFAIAAPAVIALLGWHAFVQTSYWRNSETLWTHALAATSNNDVAHNNLGFLFLRRGELDRAISHFSTALNVRSSNAATHYNLGRALIENNLANALARKGLPGEAIDHYEEAVKLRPDYADAYYNFGSVLFQQGRLDEAITQWQKALTIQPRDAEIYRNLGSAFRKKGMLKEAIVEYQQALEIVPQDRLTLANLAWILATASDASIRDGAKAVEVAQHAVELSSDGDPNTLRTLAAAYAESGRFSEATATAEQAMQIAIGQGKSELMSNLGKEITLYRAHVPLRETEPQN